MGIYSIKPAFQRRLTSVRDGAIRRGVSADALTISAVAFSVAGAACLAFSSRFAWLLLAVPVLAMGRITLNALDGLVATSTGTARPIGEVLNEFSDRLSDVAWFAGLAVVTKPILMLSVLVLVLLGSYLGTVVKAAGGPRVYSGVMGKADRMIVLSVASVAAFLFGPGALIAGTVLIGIGSVVTIVQRAMIARRQL
ncbi:MAG: CDP-alcohol phosphatidyltransferase family protein [Acidimicrobiia bacterium]